MPRGRSCRPPVSAFGGAGAFVPSFSCSGATGGRRGLSVSSSPAMRAPSALAISRKALRSAELRIRLRGFQHGPDRCEMAIAQGHDVGAGRGRFGLALPGGRRRLVCDRGAVIGHHGRLGLFDGRLARGAIGLRLLGRRLGKAGVRLALKRFERHRRRVFGRRLGGLDVGKRRGRDRIDLRRFRAGIGLRLWLRERLAFVQPGDAEAAETEQLPRRVEHRRTRKLDAHAFARRVGPPQHLMAAPGRGGRKPLRQAAAAVDQLAADEVGPVAAGEGGCRCRAGQLCNIRRQFCEESRRIALPENAQHGPARRRRRSQRLLRLCGRPHPALNRTERIPGLVA